MKCRSCKGSGVVLYHKIIGKMTVYYAARCVCERSVPWSYLPSIAEVLGKSGGNRS